jgi:hypothetical protein
MRRRLAACFVLLFFEFLRIGLFEESSEVVELVLPEDAVEGKPVGGMLHGSDGETTGADSSGFFLLDKAGLLENVEVFENGGHGNIVRAGKFCYGGVSSLQGEEDGSTRGIAERGEGGVEAGQILNHTVMYYSRWRRVSSGRNSFNSSGWVAE